MDLALLYTTQVAELPTLPGIRFSSEQRSILRRMCEVVESESPYIFTPEELELTRRSGKTAMLLAIARKYSLPLVVHNTAFARSLQRQHLDIVIVSGTHPHTLRGLGRYVLVDECLDINRLKDHARIITGINGRRNTNEYY